MFPVSGGTSGEGAELMDHISFSLLTKITGGSQLGWGGGKGRVREVSAGGAHQGKGENALMSLPGA